MSKTPQLRDHFSWIPGIGVLRLNCLNKLSGSYLTHRYKYNGSSTCQLNVLFIYFNSMYRCKKWFDVKMCSLCFSLARFIVNIAIKMKTNNTDSVFLYLISTQKLCLMRKDVVLLWRLVSFSITYYFKQKETSKHC